MLVYRDLAYIQDDAGLAGMFARCRTVVACGVRKGIPDFIQCKLEFQWLMTLGRPCTWDGPWFSGGHGGSGPLANRALALFGRSFECVGLWRPHAEFAVLRPPAGGRMMFGR